MSKYYKNTSSTEITIEGRRLCYIKVFNDIAQSAQRFIQDTELNIKTDSMPEFQMLICGAIINGGLDERRVAADLKVSFSTLARWTVGASAPVPKAQPIVAKKLVSMARQTILNAGNMMCADLIFDEGYVSLSPWYSSFVLNEQSGYFSDGFEASRTHNIFGRVSSNQFECIKGVHSIMLKLDDAAGAQCEIDRGDDLLSCSLVESANPFTPK